VTLLRAVADRLRPRCFWCAARRCAHIGRRTSLGYPLGLAFAGVLALACVAFPLWAGLR